MIAPEALGGLNPRPDPRSRVWPACEPRDMATSELMAIVRRHKHPHISAIGLESNRWGDRAREAAGLVGRYGTLYVVEHVGGEWDASMVIPLGMIPYYTRREAAWHPDQHRFQQQFGRRTERGWRNILATLCRWGALRPHEDLSYLMGEDSFKLVPREYHRK